MMPSNRLFKKPHLKSTPKKTRNDTSFDNALVLLYQPDQTPAFHPLGRYTQLAGEALVLVENSLVQGNYVHAPRSILVKEGTMHRKADALIIGTKDPSVKQQLAFAHRLGESFLGQPPTAICRPDDKR
jgi:hypothetical protein